MPRKFFSNELEKGAFILFAMMMFYNFLNFLFHFSMGRLLGPVNYGVLAVLMSIVYIFSVPSEAIQNIISRYTSRLNIKKENSKIKFLMLKSLKKGFKISLTLFLVSIFISIALSKFLEINFWLIMLTNVLIFSSLILPIIRGILQGRKKFSSLGNSLIIESTFKLIFSVSLVVLGFKVFGAMGGVLLGVSAGIIFSFYFNKDILNEKERATGFDRIYSKSIPYFVAMFVVFLIFGLDIILAKRFFSPELAGQYSVLSMLGKIIFFATIAISKVMFPLTSEKHDKNENSTSLFKKSFLIVLFICLIAIFIYGFFPKLIIGILYGKDYLDMAPYLVYSAIALSFLSLSNLILMYGLSTKGLKYILFLPLFLAIEIILLYFFRGNIQNYIIAFMVSNIIMFIGSFFFLKR